ncbi:MAG: hypothetical protein AAF628_04845 [Planctomycetota bacterium]
MTGRARPISPSPSPRPGGLTHRLAPAGLARPALARAALGLAALGLSALGLTGCAVGGSALDRSRYHMARGNYFLAYHELADREEYAGTTELRVAELAYLIWQGQRMVFSDREQQALGYLGRALELAPDNLVARQWMAKAQEKLAVRATRRGDELRMAGDLQEALDAYHEASTLVPDLPAVAEGVRAIDQEVTRRVSRAQTHYIDGVRAHGEQLWGQAYYHMVNAVDKDPKHDRARERRDHVAERLVEQRYEATKDLAAARHYGAALKEYLAIQELEPELAGLADRITHMRVEVKVEGMVREAEMAVFKQDYSSAREKLEAALDMTVTEQVAISDLLVLVREYELEDRYGEAHVLELEDHLEDALGVFQEIAGIWSDFKDVQARISSLQASIDAATEAYALGEAAEGEGDIEAAIDAFGEVQLHYPGYRDTDAKLRTLRAKVEG